MFVVLSSATGETKFITNSLNAELMETQVDSLEKNILNVKDKIYRKAFF